MNDELMASWFPVGEDASSDPATAHTARVPACRAGLVGHHV